MSKEPLAIPSTLNYFETQHQFFFDVSGPVPIKDIASSLIALEKVIFKTQSVFQALDPEMDLKEIEVLISSIESGSLKDNFITRFVFGSEEGLNRFSDKLRTITGVEAMQSKNEFVGQLIALCLVTGLGYAVIRSASGGGGTTIHIEQVRDSILNVGEGTLTITPQDLKSLVDENLKNTHSLATNAAKVILPAKRGTESRLVIDEREELQLTSGVINETPTKVPQTGSVEKIVSEKNADVLIRATDRDSIAKGWWVQLPHLFEDRRIRAELDPSIDINWLASQSRINANIKIHYKISATGAETVREVFIESILQKVD